MKKEEKIKEAWGSVSCEIDENGWLFFGYACNGMDDVEDWLKENVLNNELDYYNITYDLCDNGDLIHVKIRPKSLQGIETNNNWIKIESENDLPTPELKKEYYFISLEKNTSKSEVIRGFTDKTGKYFICSESYRTIFYNDTFYKITHYQQIEKPKPPIY